MQVFPEREANQDDGCSTASHSAMLSLAINSLDREPSTSASAQAALTVATGWLAAASSELTTAF